MKKGLCFVSSLKYWPQTKLAIDSAKKYNSDYDINEQMTGKDIKTHIQSKIKQIEKSHDIWYIESHKTNKYFQINTIANIDGILTDINDTIWLEKEPSKKNKIISLKEDIDQLINEGNYWKALKRLYSLSLIDKLITTKNEKNILIDLFNSNIGLLSSIISQLEIIMKITKITNSPKLLITNNLSICQLKLNKIYEIPIEDKLFKMFSLRYISKLYNILYNKLQDYTRRWICHNKSLFDF